MAALDKRLQVLDSLKRRGREQVEVHLQQDILALQPGVRSSHRREHIGVGSYSKIGCHGCNLHGLWFSTIA